MRIIAFCGPKSAGKDTAASYLLARNSLQPAGEQPLFQRINFADPLKVSTGIIFGYTDQEMNDPVLKETVVDRWPYKSPREILQNFAHMMRTMYTQDIWVRGWVRNIRNITAQCIVVTDLRHQEELLELQALKACIFYVDNPKVEKQREEGMRRGDPRWTDPSEAMAPLLRTTANVILDNSGSLQDLYDQVGKATEKYYGSMDMWTPLSASSNVTQPINTTPPQRA